MRNRISILTSNSPRGKYEIEKNYKFITVLKKLLDLIKKKRVQNCISIAGNILIEFHLSL